MPDFPIDPELRIRASPPIVLRRTTEAVDFIRKVALSTPDRAWQDLLQSFEAARDEWGAMEGAVLICVAREAFARAKPSGISRQDCACRSSQKPSASPCRLHSPAAPTRSSNE